MRTVWGISFAGWLGACAVGIYFGMVVAGLLAVLTGQGGSTWPAAVVLAAVLGAVGGWLLAGFSRGRPVPSYSRRTLVCTVGGLVSFPLALAAGELHQLGGVGIVLVVGAGVVGIARYLRRRLRRVPARFDGHYARAAR
ncbi:MAG: hypothetical protein ACRDQU_15660 [Pseudonocardiaceae bacterium]